MVYLHEEVIDINLVRRWANEVADGSTDIIAYKTPTKQIHKIGYDEYYSEAIDLDNMKRIELGLVPYYYEPTDRDVDIDDTAEDE